MAKNEVATMTVDEENEQKALYGGVLLSDIQDIASAVRSQEEKSQSASGVLSRAKELFKKKGGNIRGMMRALKDLKRDMADVMDEQRTYEIYFRALGGQEQIDMFDQEMEQRKNADSIESATVAAKAASPQTGMEITH